MPDYGNPILIAGLATVTVDGTQIAVRANCVVSPDPIEREGISGQDRVHGYREMPRVPYIELDVSMQANQPVNWAATVVGNSTVVALLADGRTFQLNQAWYRGATEIATQEGQYRARFEGFSCVEIVGAV